MITKNLRYKNFWLAMGFTMITFVVYQTLTSSPLGTGIRISDKLLHITGYFGMMGWFVQIFNDRKQKILLAAGFVGMGIMLEFIQGWGGIRQYEVADMLANTTGVALAWALAYTRFSDILLTVESVIHNKN